MEPRLEIRKFNFKTLVSASTSDYNGPLGDSRHLWTATPSGGDFSGRECALWHSGEKGT